MLCLGGRTCAGQEREGSKQSLRLWKRVMTGRLDVYSDCFGSQQVSISFVGVGRNGSGQRLPISENRLDHFSSNNDDSATTQQRLSDLVAVSKRAIAMLNALTKEICAKPEAHYTRALRSRQVRLHISYSKVSDQLSTLSSTKPSSGRLPLDR
jgi:hypothetical protein